ncbi:MAG: hypothetical protein K9I70_04560 [Chitinophagaceae bacterium]|nr:hypothetical protein [Chitinophagaceae bacterium]
MAPTSIKAVKPALPNITLNAAGAIKKRNKTTVISNHYLSTLSSAITLISLQS